MQTKLHINLSQGTVVVEGDVELVREVYSDFKDRLLSNQTQMREHQELAAEEASKRPPPKKKKRAAPRKTATADADDSGVDPASPKLDKNLDLSKLGTFFNQFEPKNHPERILIFAKFLTEELGIDEPNTDQFYSCYKELKEKIPSAFAQAFWDTHGKSYGYIDFKSATDITIPIKGTNHFNHGITRKGAE